MKKYLSFILNLVVFVFCTPYIIPVFASECTSNLECESGNCVADQCYDNTISSPCLSNSACASKNCYAGRCCPQTYPMEGSCPKKSMAKEIPVVKNVENDVADDTLILNEELKTTEDVGMRFSGMTGQVEWRADNDPDGWKLCKMGDKLPVFAHIRTQEDSVAILSFADMSTFVLKPESEVVLDAPPGPESKIKLVAGNIWVNVKKMVTDGSMEIEMNQAVAGIKGTTFVLWDKDGISSIKVIEGLVEFTDKIGGRMEKIATGETIISDKSGLGIKGTFNITAENKLWEDLMAEDDIKNLAEENSSTDLKIIFGLGLFLVVSLFVYIKIKK